MVASADKRLAKRLLDGDQRSFDAFFNNYYPRLFRFALSRLENDDDLADETAQVVLCQAISRMDTYRGEAPLFTWLCTFCRYEISKQRKAKRRAQGDVPLVEDDPAVQAALDSLLAHARNDPEVAASRTEIRRLVKVALDHLPSLYADVLESKYLRDLSVNEIASLIGKSPKATESVLTRARAAFRDSFTTLATEHAAPSAALVSMPPTHEY
ncbi:MAG: sigma-70 family RNA polymerase sigma factor [Gammaproteobacteria bacterium]|nr:sigma-70 family RNA polymerase sigma factor [Gammaproteobacteria bacterium]